MTTATEILQDARDRIKDPEHWTKGSFARDEYGHACHPTSPYAVCFCSIGTLMRSFYELSASAKEREGASNFLIEAYFGSVAEKNDRYNHSAVIQKFEQAIKLSEERSNV